LGSPFVLKKLKIKNSGCVYTYIELGSKLSFNFTRYSRQNQTLIIKKSHYYMFLTLKQSRIIGVR